MKKVSRAVGPCLAVVTMALGGVMACGGGGSHVMGVSGGAGSTGSSGSTGTGGTPTGSAGDSSTPGTAGGSGDAGSTGSGGSGGTPGTGGSASGDAGSGGATTGTGGTTTGDGGTAGAGAGGTTGAGGTADMGYTGPFTCTLVAGLLVTSEWFNAGFENDGVNGAQWEGKFQHYGYIDIWAQDPPAGFAWTAPITSACTMNSMTPDRVIFTAWSWEITDETKYIADVVTDIAEFKKNFPTIKRFELSTIVRCPMDKMCNPNAQVPPLAGADHNAAVQDCYVAPYIDDALAKVAAMYPGFVYVAPKFESPACQNPPNGAHLYSWNTMIAKTIAAYYMDPTHP